MKKLGLILIILFTILLFAGCSKTATVTGTVTYREKIALPSEGVVVIVKVEDISRADAPAITIGEQIIENPGHQVPIPFEVQYNPDDIDERYTYAMRVRIEVDGKLWFINDTRYHVITHGFPTSNVEIVLKEVGARETTALEDITWVLESYGKTGNLQAVLENTEITAAFENTKGQVTGSAGCNNYFGGYDLKGNELSLTGPIGSTMMSCGEQIDQQEIQYLQILQNAESYKIEGNQLQITSGDKVLIFKLK